MAGKTAAVDRLRRAGSADSQHGLSQKKRRRPWLAVFLVLVLAGGLFVWFRAGIMLGDRIGAELTAHCTAQGVECVVTEPYLAGFTTFRAKEIQIYVKRLALPLTFSNIVLNVKNLSAVFSGTVTGELTADAYEGRIRANGTFEVGTQSLDGRLFVNHLSLAGHPSLQGFGVRAGELDVDLDTVQVNRGQLARLLGSVSVAGLTTGRELGLPPALVSLAMRNQKVDPEAMGSISRFVKIPKLDRFSLYGELSAADGTFEIQKIKSDSNLGTARGSFSTIGRNGRYRAEIVLSSDGQKSLGPLFSLGSQGVVQPDVKELVVEGTGETGRWRTTFIPKVQPPVAPPSQIPAEEAAIPQEPAAEDLLEEEFVEDGQ